MQFDLHFLEQTKFVTHVLLLDVSMLDQVSHIAIDLLDLLPGGSLLSQPRVELIVGIEIAATERRLSNITG